MAGMTGICGTAAFCGAAAFGGAREAGVGLAAAATTGAVFQWETGWVDAGSTIAACRLVSVSACTAGVETVVIMATSVPVAAPASMQIPKGVLILVLRGSVRFTIRQFY